MKTRYLSSHDLIAIMWSMTVLAFMFTVGRFAIHWQNRKRVQWDDILNGLSATFLLAFACTYQIFGPYDYNRSLATLGVLDESPILDMPTLRRFRKYNAANSLLFCCAIYSAKASFLALYWLIFRLSLRFRIAWTVAVVYTVLSFGISFMWSFWRCGNPKWYLAVKCPPGTELYFPTKLIAWGVLDVVGSVLLLALPIAMLKGLLMRTSQKVELGIIFGLVLINIVSGIMRTLFAVGLGPFPFLDQYTLWIFLEATLAVIICALPCYRGLLSSGKLAPLPCMCERAGDRASNSWANTHTLSSDSSEFPGNSWQSGA